MSERRLAETRASMSGGNRLLQTTMMNEAMSENDQAIGPLDYFPLPPNPLLFGRLVVAYVHISEKGILTGKQQPYYGVTTVPRNAGFTSPGVVLRSQQCQVYAEHLSLRSGLFTTDARLTSELTMAEYVPEVWRGAYLQDRVDHLKALASDVDTSDQLEKRQRKVLLGELSKTVTELTARVE